MALEVIGAGFGRTGTLSLKAALEALGFGPCYHQYELVAHPDHASSWTAAYEGDAEALVVPLRDYQSTVDWPGCSFWRELAQLIPDAKVVLSVRPAERWYASFRETVGALLSRKRRLDEVPLLFVPVVQMNEKVIRDRCFGADFDVEDSERIMAAYDAHNAAVRAGVESERLLEFDVADGWDDLCRFLSVPVPETAFPNVNDREQFNQLFGLREHQRDREKPVDPEDVQHRFREAMGQATRDPLEP